MIKKITIFIFFILLILTAFRLYNYKTRTDTVRNIESSTSQKNTFPVVAFIRNRNLWIRANDTETQLTTDGVTSTGPESVYYRNPRNSPDNTYVAVIRGSNDSRKNTLFVFTTNGQKSGKQIADDVDGEIGFVQWKSDGTIYYVSSKENEYEAKVIKNVSPATLIKQTIGEYSVHSGCGGGSADPGDRLSWSENLKGWPVTFLLSPIETEIVHNTQCTGNGIAFFNITKATDEQFEKQGTGTVYSPDGTLFAFTLAKDIKIFSTQSKKLVRTISVEESPSALYFNTDNSTLFFTTVKEDSQLLFDAQTAQTIFGTGEAYFRKNMTTIWKADTQTGSVKKIASFDAHDGKPLYTFNNTLYLSLVENATELFNYYSKNRTQVNEDQHMPKVNVVEVNINTGANKLFISDASQTSF